VRLDILLHGNFEIHSFFTSRFSTLFKEILENTLLFLSEKTRREIQRWVLFLIMAQNAAQVLDNV
jgi:hypothetical protein